MAGFNPFGSVPVQQHKRTNFNESFELAGTFPLSKLCPVCFIDSLPGSSWNINAFNLTRLETLIAPAMQRVDASILWFKMPKRLLFKHFKKWYSGGDDGKDDHQKPHIFLKKTFEKYYDAIDTPLVVSSDLSGVLQKFSELFVGPGSLWNYLGLPTPLNYNTSTGVWELLSIENWDFTENGDLDEDFIDALPLMAYNLLYDTYFRDPTLNDPIFVDGEEQDFTINRIWTSDVFSVNSNKYRFVVGPDSVPSISGVIDIQFLTTNANLYEGGELSPNDFLALLILFNRAWKKDYYTSALPTPQRGPDVKLSMVAPGQSAPVQITDGQSVIIGNPDNDGTGQPVFRTDSALGSQSDAEFHPVSSNKNLLGQQMSEVFNIEGNLQGSDGAIVGTADLSGLSPITIVALRNLFKLQSFLEKNNVSGGRYIETILAHWGERVPDFTVQRPQFIRATKLPVQISEVVATANSSGTSSIVGDLAGRARTQGNIGSVHIYTQEPSFIFGLYCVTAPPAYAGQGIPRMFQHITRFDEPWPDFAHIGEQAIKTRELFYGFGSDSVQNEDFGYQQRFSEYKYMPDRVVGDFQTSFAYWHMARMFTQAPKLNADFVTQNLDPRIFAVQSGRPVTASFYFEATAKLKLSKYSTPKIS